MPASRSRSLGGRTSIAPGRTPSRPSHRADRCRRRGPRDRRESTCSEASTPHRQILLHEQDGIEQTSPRPRVGQVYQTIACRPPHWERARAGGNLMSMPFYVSPEQVMARQGGVRPQGHRPRQVHRHARVRRRHPADRRERRRTSRRSARSTTGSRSPVSASSASSISCGRSACATPTPRAIAYSRDDVRARALANAYSQMDGRRSSPRDLKPLEVEVIVAEVGEPQPASGTRHNSHLPCAVRRQHQRPRRLLRVIGGDGPMTSSSFLEANYARRDAPRGCHANLGRSSAPARPRAALRDSSREPRSLRTRAVAVRSKVPPTFCGR